MKYDELSNETQKECGDWVTGQWTRWSEVRGRTLSRITNYLFVLNSGALLATLSYISAKPEASDAMMLPIRLFFGGLMCIVGHAAKDYYSTEAQFATFRKNADDFMLGTTTWKQFMALQNKSNDWLLNLLGWISALAVGIGIVLGIEKL